MKHYPTIVTIIALTSLGANAYTVQNIRNIAATRQVCSEQNNVSLRNCQLRVVNLTPAAESDTQKLTLLMPPELIN